MTASLKFPKKHWTPDEIEYLGRVIEDPEGVKVQEVADFLGRSNGAVRSQIHRMKKKKDYGKIEFNFNGWRPDEIRYLKRTAPHCSYREIAEELNKTASAVEQKAYKLGIKKQRSKVKYADFKKYATGEYTVKEIAYMLNMNPGAVYERIKRTPEFKYKKVDEENRQKIKEREYRRWQYYKQISSNSRM